MLSVDEACTNIIKHAYKHSNEGQIEITIAAEGGEVVINITDSGNHFDPDSIPVPNLERNVKEGKPGGLGMFLMKKLMDEVTYDTLSQGRNCVKLVKYI